MDEQLHTLDIENLASLNTDHQALTALESGKVIYLPSYSFRLQEAEEALLLIKILDGKHKM